jgi:uncharacterized membrane protein YhaH (DUF805 family)
MQLDSDVARNAVVTVNRHLFGGRIARTTFVIRVAILAAMIFFLIAPLNTFLAPSSKLLKDAYMALGLGMLVLCLLGFVSAYVKRLHDIGVAGYWAFLALIGFPAATFWALSSYASYRWRSDHSFDTADVNQITGWIAFGLPLLIVLWKGDSKENRFGPVPPPVEHFTASKFNIAAILGTAAILIPTSIYAGLFQSGVWVGRGPMASSMPMIDSNSTGRLLAKCWNLKGVGAGTGEGPMSGVYRDGYGGSVLDFVVSDAGQIDIVPAGQTFSKAYRADGFTILPYGLDKSGQIITKGRNRFMIAAVYDGSNLPDGGVNFTTFSFGKTGETWPEWQVVMASGLSLGENPLFESKELARGRLMIGDCVVR